MSGVSLADLRHVVWSETLKLALARGVASSAVLTFAGLMLGAFRGADVVHIVAFALLWPFLSFVGGIGYTALLKLISTLLTPFAGEIVGLCCSIAIWIVALAIACGDPLVFALIRRAPHMLDVSDFRLFNIKAVIFVLDPGESPAGPADDAQADNAEYGTAAAHFFDEALPIDPFVGTVMDHGEPAQIDPTLTAWIARARTDEQGVLADLAAGQFDSGDATDRHYVKAVALATVAIKSYLNDGGGAEHLLGLSGDGLPSLIAGEALGRAIEALDEVADVERVNPNYAFGPIARFRDSADQLDLCMQIVDEALPGAVQQVLGWTTPGILGKRSSAIKDTTPLPLAPGLSREMAADLLEAVGDVRFQTPLPCRSLLLVGSGRDSHGRFVCAATIELDQRTAATVGDANLFGWIDLYENGMARYRAGDDDVVQRSVWPLKDRAPNMLRLATTQIDTLQRFANNDIEHAYVQPSRSLWPWLAAAFCLLLGVPALRSCSFHGTGVSPTPVVTSTIPMTAPDVVAAASPTNYTTSFDCRRATGRVEQRICHSPSLAMADQTQATLYAGKMHLASGSDATALRTAQRGWLKDRNACRADPCIEAAFARRIAELQAWMPTPANEPSTISVPEMAPKPPEPDIRSGRAPSPPLRSTSSSGPGRPDNHETGLETCVLPTGQEIRLSRPDCRTRGGVIY